MTRATLLARVLLAVALAVATGVHQSRAQCVTNVCPPPPGPSGGGGGSDNGNNRALWYAAGGVLAIIAGWAIKTQLFPDPGPGGSPPPPGGPYGPSAAFGQIGQLDPTPPAPRLGGLPPAGGSGGGSNVASKSGSNKGGSQGGSQTASRRGFDVPPFGVPFVPNEVILDIPSSVPTATLDAIARAHMR